MVQNTRQSAKSKMTRKVTTSTTKLKKKKKKKKGNAIVAKN